MPSTNHIPSFTVIGRFKPIVPVLALVLLAVWAAHPASAATRTWTGGHASSANWNLRDNWGGVAVPARGDTLVFPAGAARLLNTNNIPGLSLNAIEFTGAGGGYNLRGLGLTLSNGVAALGGGGANNTIRLDSLALETPQSFFINSGGWLTVGSDLVLNGSSLLVAAAGDCTLSGTISGNGNITKTGSGLLTLSGPDDNTVAGNFYAHGGSVALNKRETISLMPITFVSHIAIPGNLFIGDGSGADTVVLNYENQIANLATVTVGKNAVLDFNGNTDIISNLVMSGGVVTTGAGQMTLIGGLTTLSSTNPAMIDGVMVLNSASTFTIADGPADHDLEIHARIGSLGGWGFTKSGPGTLRLLGTNTYLGATFVNEGLVRVASDAPFGAANNGTTIATGAELLIEPPVDTLREPLTIAGAGLGGASGAIRIGSGATIATNIVLSAPATIFTMGGGNLTIDGVISGTGPLTKIGPGTLELGGKSANTFSGNLLAQNGVLLLSKLAGSAVQGDLVIGTTNTAAIARHTRSANLGGAVTVNAASLYDLDGHNESIDALTLNGGGDVQTYPGQLTLDGDMVVRAQPGPVLATSRISGRLHVGTGERHINIEYEDNGPGDLADVGDLNELIIHAHVTGSANLIKSGPGDFIFTASNSFTGTLTMEDGELYITDGHGLGATNGQTILTGDASLIVFGTYDYEATGEGIVVEEPLSMNTTGQANGNALYSFGSNVWSGAISLAQNTSVNVYTNHVLHLAGVVNGPAGLTKTGPGLLIYSGTAANTYLGATVVNEGTMRLERGGGVNRAIPGALVVGDGAGGPEADVVEAVAASQIANLAPVSINASGALRIQGDEIIGSLSGSGRLELQGAPVELQTGENGASTIFAGVISGTGALRKRGAGTFTLTGTNTYTGLTTVALGTLIVEGEQPSSDVIVQAVGTLGGGGEVGELTVHGTLSPGNPSGQTLGQLEAASVDFEPGSHYVVQLGGPMHLSGHDSIFVTGDVDLTGATLDVSLDYAPIAGREFGVVFKEVPGPVTGTFNGLPEGTQLVLNHIPLNLSYVHGSDDNNVVLTVGELPLRLGNARVEAGNGNGRIDPDECDHLFLTLENATGAGVNVVSAHLHSLRDGIVVTHGEGSYGIVPALGFRTNRAALQIRSAPDYPCGQNAEFHLVLDTAAHGHFAIPVTLPTGSPDAFRAFPSANGPQPIPDLGSLSSQVPVADDFRVGKVRLSLHASHPAAGDLRFRLRSPDGTEVTLAANQGGNAPNYGNNCSSRATFDDEAATKIAAAAAPFAGTFAPEANLADFLGESSSGIWTLLVEDTVAGDAGALQCWSLELAPAECASGGGGCESCLATLHGSLSDFPRTMPNKLLSAIFPSGCGDPKPCKISGPWNISPFRYNTHTFTNTGPEVCVTVVLSVPCGTPGSGLSGSAYLGDFNPEDLCANYLGSTGRDIENGSGGFSFRVPAGQQFTVVVNENNYDAPFQGCDNYSLELYGLPCPQAAPTLHIANDTGPDNVRLHWSTAYPGFDLQGTRGLGANGLPPVFTNVTAAPVVIDGHYSVTNQHNGTNNGFFRLRKP